MNAPRGKAARSGFIGAEEFVPRKIDTALPQLKKAADLCRGCDLYKRATQAVFGEIEGEPDAKKPTATMMLVGEQPGDQEDLQGHPFVGPAGKLLDRALVEAGIERKEVYVTNAVKHFNWVEAPRGKRRLHAKPRAGHIDACKPWLQREIELVKPKVIVCLGATAGQALLGKSFRVTVSRGKALTSPEEMFKGVVLMGTVHPSAILRAPSDEERHKMFEEFVKDLKSANGAV
jgi:uracil-DNA glycosylase family protein